MLTKLKSEEVLKISICVVDKKRIRITQLPIMREN
jgi:hypothetical protein